MMTFSKTLVTKSSGKLSVMDSDELEFGNVGGAADNYAEKISPSNLTFGDMNNIYYANVWIRAIVDRIVDRVCNIQPMIKPIYSKIEDEMKDSKDLPDIVKKKIESIQKWIANPNDNNESFTSLRKKVLRDILKYDSAGYEIVRGVKTGDEKIIRLYAVAGDTIKLNPNKKGMLEGNNAYQQIDSGMKKVASWNKDEIIYFVSNPQSGRVYGTSPLESLNQTVIAELNASQYNSDFFKNNATPRIAVMMEKMGMGQASAAMKRFKNWWEKELEGKPHKPIILGTEQGSVKIEKISMSNTDMQFSEYLFWLLIKIMAVYKMQPAIMGISPKDSKPGDIKEQLEQFKIDAIKPQLSLFKEKINTQIIWNKKAIGFDDIYLDFDLEMGDKDAEAKVHKSYLESGVVMINEVRAMIGLTPVYWGNVPYLQNNVAPFGLGNDGT